MKIRGRFNFLKAGREFTVLLKPFSTEIMITIATNCTYDEARDLMEALNEVLGEVDGYEELGDKE